MSPGTHRRQVLLFFVAVLLPCLVLVGLTLRMASQQKELAQKREAEDRQHALREIRERLLSKLEVIESRALDQRAAQQPATWSVMPSDASVALIAWLDGNRLALPWQTDRSITKFPQPHAETQFERKLRDGMRAELSEGNPGKAVPLYLQATQSARLPVQSANARLLLARALFKSGRRDQALAIERQISLLPFEIRDDQEVPFSLYAATELVKSGSLDPAALDHLRSEVASRRWLPPAEAYMLRDLCEALARGAEGAAIIPSADHLRREAIGRVKLTEQVLALQDDLPGLMPLQSGVRSASQTEPLWVAYGPEPWLVGVAAPAKHLPQTLVVIHARDLLQSIQEDRADSASPSFQALIVAGNQGQGESLGASFPGLRVQLTPKNAAAVANRGALESSYYLFALLLVLSVTFFGAYLVWRDVRRELRLAATRSQFVSSVSHELRTPLAAIRMFAETLRMGRATTPEVEAEYLDTILNESERLTRLLDNVLDFSKIERGERTYKRKPASLTDVVQAAARTLRYPLQSQGFALRVEIEDHLPPASVDSDAIEQAILNLLTNAMKYSPNSREIQLKLARRNREAVIQVSDHGIGIPAGEQSRIFEKFYRIATPENQQVPGTGLGLTLVEHIVKAHGGRVEVASAPGNGSVFSLVLPLEINS